MKNLFKMFAVLMLITGVQGCYTILWSPEMEFPNAENSYNYYESYYFYDYDNYYNYPWWYRISPPYYDLVGDRSDDQENLRNGDSGRSSGGRGDILPTPPPGRPGGGGGGTTNPPQGDSNSSKSGSSDSGRDSNIRNNDSERNTDKGRR